MPYLRPPPDDPKGSRLTFMMTSSSGGGPGRSGGEVSAMLGGGGVRAGSSSLIDPLPKLRPPPGRWPRRFSELPGTAGPAGPEAEEGSAMVVGGEVRVRGTSQAGGLAPGDYLNIPAHLRHRLEWTDPDQETVWVAVFYK